MHLENAEPEPVSGAGAVARRNLFVRAGVAGIAGIAASFVVDRRALATPIVPDLPASPTEADKRLLEQALGLELALSRLYEAALDAGPSDELATVVGVVAENHQAYAQRIAGVTGLSVKNADPDLVESNRSAFTGSETGFLEVAHQLEQQAVATHSELLSDYESIDAIKLTASILVMEARYATVWADFLGIDDLDTIFANDASALQLSASGGA